MAADAPGTAPGEDAFGNDLTAPGDPGGAGGAGPRVTVAEVLHVAKLAKLRLTEAEAEHFAGQLAGIVAYVDQLGEADVEGVEPMARPMTLRNVFRGDAPPEAPALPVGAEAALANAPAKAGPYFTVPRVLGGGGSAGGSA